MLCTSCNICASVFNETDIRIQRENNADADDVNPAKIYVFASAMLHAICKNISRILSNIN